MQYVANDRLFDATDIAQHTSATHNGERPRQPVTEKKNE